MIFNVDKKIIRISMRYPSDDCFDLNCDIKKAELQKIESIRIIATAVLLAFPESSPR